MQEAALATFKEHAHSCVPAECCGLLIIYKGREVYRPCRNVLSAERWRFEIDCEDYAAAEDMGEIVAVCHSHPNYSAHPSESDLVGIEDSKLPWYILGLPSEVLTRTEPTGWKAPLIGRQFFFGTLDCYAICRDYYRETYGLELRDYPRTDKFWERGENLYVDNFAKEGFVQIDEKNLRAGDAILFQMYASLPNHAAIFLGDNVILQHLNGRLSGREVYGGYYRKTATHFLRHKSLC